MADYYSENESSSESSADSTVERNNSSSSFASSVENDQTVLLQDHSTSLPRLPNQSHGNHHKDHSNSSDEESDGNGQTPLMISLGKKRHHSGDSDSGDDFLSKKSKPKPQEANFITWKGKSTSDEGDSEEEAFQKKPTPSQTDGNTSQYSSAALNMMRKMGHQVGTGLGARGQGIVEPVKESIQMGRAGLGLRAIKELEREEVAWEKEDIEIKEVPIWMDACSLDLPTEDEMADWVETGPRKDSIEDETEFCDPEILAKILKNKAVFDNLGRKEFLAAREKANPFETIKGVIFQNRAAMKMANLDAIFGFIFTDPTKSGERKLTERIDLMYFADICAGPGGFTEYFLYRTKWHAKGFGFTLKSPKDGSDFKLEEFHAAPCETFEPYYGIHNNGDITNTENLQSLYEHVMKGTENEGVHFVMGDGGISVEGQENIQELLTKQLVMCQFACALSLLRKGGNFVCKLFDMYTPFLVGLIYLLYRAFNKICLVKPHTSRPANSERYVVCQGFKDMDRKIAGYLFQVNNELNELKDSERDVIWVVPRDVIMNDTKFVQYVIDNNDRIGAWQCLGLVKIQYFVKNRNLVDDRQGKMREKCLEYWKIPNSIRTISQDPNHKTVLNEHWTRVKADFSLLNTTNFKQLTTEANLPPDVHTWKWYYACGTRYLIVGCGRSNVKCWDMKVNEPHLSSVPGLSNLELPPKTILEIEVVEECKKAFKKVVYVIDVIAIYGEYLAELPYKERQAWIGKLCKALNKPGCIEMKLKPCYRLKDIIEQFDKLENGSESYKRCKPILFTNLDEQDETYISPKGIILFKTLKEPWHLHFSKKSGQFYFYNGKTKSSTYETPIGSVASYKDFLMSRHIWIWQNPQFADILGIDESNSTESKGMSRKMIIKHLEKNAL